MHAPLSKSYRVEWRGIASLDGIVDEWRELSARALEPNVFYDPEFMLAAAPLFGADVRVMLVRSAAGRLAGLFSARIERWRGLTPMLVGWTHPFAPLGTPLVDRDDAEAIIAACLDHLGQGLDQDRSMPRTLLMPLLPAEGAFAQAFDAALRQGGRKSAVFGRHQRALLAPGAEREGYIERTVSAGRRKELRRQRRRLEDIAPVTFAPAGTPQEVEPALKDFLLIEASGWKGAAGTAIVNDKRVRDFVERAVRALAADGRAHVDRLFLNGTAIAAVITLSSGDTAWCWKIAYSEGVARFSPGVQLALDLTERLLAQPTPARVDSCATAEHPMIDHLWHERLSLHDRLIALGPSAVPFPVARGVEALRRSGIAFAKLLRCRLRG
jgi:CelD/BcsL family acetyltransferase involved in cellulose biosynthesis